MNNQKRLSQIEVFFLALADMTRLRLLNLMREKEISVSTLIEVLGESQPKVSRHLSYLRGAGIVQARRDGKLMHYKIIEPVDGLAAQVLRTTLICLDSQEDMRGEYKRLNKICSSPNDSQTMSRTFSPDTSARTYINKRQNTELETFLL